MNTLTISKEEDQLETTTQSDGNVGVSCYLCKTNVVECKLYTCQSCNQCKTYVCENCVCKWRNLTTDATDPYYCIWCEQIQYYLII